MTENDWMRALTLFNKRAYWSPLSARSSRFIARECAPGHRHVDDEAVRERGRNSKNP